MIRPLGGHGQDAVGGAKLVRVQFRTLRIVLPLAVDQQTVFVFAGLEGNRGFPETGFLLHEADRRRFPFREITGHESYNFV